MTETVQVVCPHDGTVNRLPAARLGDGPKCGRCKQPLFVGKPLELTTEQFERHLEESGIPIVVDFWAPWCGPCRMMAPAYEEAARLLEPHYRLAKVNTDTEQALGARYVIRSIPTLAVFEHGKEVARQPGAITSPSAIADWVRRQRAAA